MNSYDFDTQGAWTTRDENDLPDVIVTHYAFFRNQRMSFEDRPALYLEAMQEYAEYNYCTIGVAQLMFAMANFYSGVVEFFERSNTPSLIVTLNPESDRVELHSRQVEVTPYDLRDIDSFIDKFYATFTSYESSVEQYSGRHDNYNDYSESGYVPTAEELQAEKDADALNVLPFQTISLQCSPLNFYTGAQYVDEKFYELTNKHLAKHSYRPRNSDDNFCFLWCIFYSLPEYESLKDKPIYFAYEDFNEWYDENGLSDFIDSAGRFNEKFIKDIEDRLKINICLYRDDDYSDWCNIYYRSRFLYEENIKIVQIPFTNFVNKADKVSRFMDHNENIFDPITEGHYAILFESFFHRKDMKKLCPYCDRAFTSRSEGFYRYKKHMEQCLDQIKNYERDDVKRLINYTVPSKYKYFEDMSCLFATPFVTGDFESIILTDDAKEVVTTKKEEIIDADGNKTMAKKKVLVTNHKAFSYTLQYYNPFNPDKNITKTFYHERDSHLLMQFNKDLIEIAKEHERVMQFKPVYKDEEIQAPVKNSDDVEICVLCQHPLRKPYLELPKDKHEKAIDAGRNPYPIHWNHLHMENDNINKHLEGWTHEQCNLKAQLANKPLKVYFHNLKSYDGAYVLSALANDPEYSSQVDVKNVLARGQSKFSELTVTLAGHSIKFSDSLQHLLGSLERIVGSSLKEDYKAFQRVKGYFEKYYNKQLPDTFLDVVKVCEEKYVNRKFSKTYLDVIKVCCMLRYGKNIPATLEVGFKKFYKQKTFLDIIKGKGVYPYKFLQLKNLNATELPSIDWFYSDLTRSHLSKKDYDHAVESWNVLKRDVFSDGMCFLDYTMFYNMLDVFLLSECLNKYNLEMQQLVGIAPLSYTSSASASAGAYFFKSQKKVNLYDVELQQLIRKNIRGGQSYTYIRNLDLKNEGYTGFYYDCNALYPTCMHRFKGNAKQIAIFNGSDAQKYYDEKIAHLTTDIIHTEEFDDLNEGYMITCNMKSHRNAELQKLARIYPFQTKLDMKPHLLSDFQNDMCERNRIKFPFKKNVPHFYPVQQITLSHRLLVMLKKWGYEFHNVTEVRVFEQENLYKEYLDILLEQKVKNSGDEFKRNQVKGLMNSLYGATIVNPDLFRDISFKNNIKEIRRAVCHPMYNGMMNVPRYVDEPVDSDGNAVERKKVAGTTDFFLVKKHQETVRYDYNSMQGFQILDDSKYVMYEFLWYILNVVLPHYNIPLEAFKMLMSDTDSFCFAIKSEYLSSFENRIDWAHDINMKIVSGELPDTDAKIGCLFDLHKSKKYGSMDYYLKHKESFGLFKEEEINEEDFVSFKSVCAKVYYYKTSSGKEVFKSKGIMKAMIKQHMTAETFDSSINRCIDAKTNSFTRDEIRMSGFSLSQRSVTKKLISEVDLKFIEMNESEYLIYGEIDFENKRLEANKRDALLASISTKN